jgi:hypothetical protein
LAHVLVSKYADHLPLYRQCEIYERQGVELERSTLADWVGGTSALLDPLVEALRRYVMAAGKLHADDTRVPVLAPGTGKTKTWRLWTYVRDDRPAGDKAAPAVWFAYSADRGGEHILLESRCTSRAMLSPGCGLDIHGRSHRYCVKAGPASTKRPHAAVSLQRISVVIINDFSPLFRDVLLHRVASFTPVKSPVKKSGSRVSPRL